jgi:hypothetical protein
MTYLMKLSLLIAELVLAFTLGPVAAYSQQVQTYPSPDGAMLARITPASRKCLESRAEIRKKSGLSLFRKSYRSVDCQHGMNILRGAWTPDSMFFVFNTQMSGGHQPWHWPVYFYSRSDNKIHSLDDLAGSIIVPEFRLKAAHLVETRVLDQGNDAGRPVTVDLKRNRQRKHH